MQLPKNTGKILAVGTLGAIMFASSISFAALKDFPEPFVKSGSLDSLVVVGSTAAPSDVVGAIDLAGRLGSQQYTIKNVGSSTAGDTVSGEGKALYTDTTKIFLQDNLGKTGLRTTLTKTDMPKLLADTSFTDTNGAHTAKLYVDLTPGTTNAANARLDFDKPGSSTSNDPVYNFGRFTTSPGTGEYMYRIRMVWDVGINGTNSVGKTVKLFNNEYVVSSDTTALLGATTSNKLVLFGGSNKVTMYSGDTQKVTVGSKEYTVKLIGVTTANAAVVDVDGTTETVARLGTSTNFGDVKIYISDAAQLSSTDLKSNFAVLLIGADKLTFQHGSKVKRGTTDDTVDGTYVSFTATNNLLNEVDIYFAGSSSTNDYVAAGNKYYENPIFKTFGLSFPSTTPAVGGTSDDDIKLQNSGDSATQVTFIDNNGYSKTVSFGYRPSSSSTQLTLADSSNNAIHVVEGDTVNRDEYIVLDAGGFPHMFRVSSVNLDGSSSASIDLQDVFSGTTTTIKTGSGNSTSAVIDGQSYGFGYVSPANFTVRWGNASNWTTAGSHLTVFPTLKTKSGALIAFAQSNVSVAVNTTVQLPTGAVTITGSSAVGETAGFNWTITAVGKEDGTASVATNYTVYNANSVVFSIGRTATGALRYIATRSGNTVLLSVAGSGTTEYANPTVILVEEKDDAGNQGSAAFQTSLTSSSGTMVTGFTTPTFMGTNSGSQSWGTSSVKSSYANYWGTIAVRDTGSSTQPTIEVWYPDTQRVANVYVLAKDATITTTAGSSATTVHDVTPVKTTLGKLDSEATADKSTKNLILVGGPAVNTLVADLGTAGKTWTRDQYVEAGAGTAIIQLVDDAFTTGKSVLIVAGYEASDTRAATSFMQSYDDHASDLAAAVNGTLVLKNGVRSVAA
ncbi:MAG: S-layer protein [Candidatus Aenigmarchaeota archaeon]|nr:S-layer protein [Candidatus Aenigmarchaeota archaeon]